MSSLIVEVCKVDSVIKHPNADKLSIVTVKGWNCIVGLDQYKEGDKVTYIPPDAILPSELIEKYNLTYLKNGGRTGTLKLRGYISQGLILDVPDGNYSVGDDVAKVLGITKYEPDEPTYQANLKGKAPTKKKLNPAFDKFTDIENIKNYNSVFKDGDEVIITEKIHGSNWRAGNLPIWFNQSNIFKKAWYYIKSKFTDGYEFVYGSHNVQLSYFNKDKNFYGEDIYGKVAKKYNMKDIIPKDYIIYGEVYGNGIQDLTYGLEDIDLVIFAIKHNGKYLDWSLVEDFCKEKGLKTVPILYVGLWNPSLLSTHTDGKSIICPSQIREGCVVCASHETNDPRIGRKILKSVSVNYLTRKNATEYH